MPWSLASLAYTLAKDLVALVRGRRRRLSQSEIVQLRAKWKAEFEKELTKRALKEKLSLKKIGRDVIIRDVKRVDKYPRLDEKEKGISPWFRVGLVGTYHRGILALLDWSTLTRTATGEWRYRSRKDGEEGDIKVALIGYIPYENIEHVDWDGDEYNYKPIIFCHFDAKKGQPYEEIAFCEKRMLDDHEYYTKIAEYEAVRKASVNAGVDDFA
jgi:hypothetical protein